jgi:hypothetical protein
VPPTPAVTVFRMKAVQRAGCPAPSRMNTPTVSARGSRQRPQARSAGRCDGAPVSHARHRTQPLAGRTSASHRDKARGESGSWIPPHAGHMPLLVDPAERRRDKPRCACLRPVSAHRP